jgi:cell division transport system permease protein
MNTVSFFRVIRSGFTNFWRNIWMSAAATMVMVITLVILSTLLLLFLLTNYSVKTVRERVDISAYFKTGLAESQIMAVKQQVENEPLVTEVTYTSAADGLVLFKQRHANDKLLTESINALDENPIQAVIHVKAANLSDYQQISDELRSDKYAAAIDKVNFEDNRDVIVNLNRILKFIITFGIILAAVFSVIAILVIFNTITLTIYNRREEIEIMRLVGATNWYIRGPFLTEAIIYSIAATVITGAVVIPLYIKLLPTASNFLNPGSNLFAQDFIPLPYILLGQLGVAVILSVISTFLATRKYLKI